MPTPQDVIAAVSNIDQMVSALDTLVDQLFTRTVQIEILNGEVDSAGHTTRPGVPEIICAHDYVQKNTQTDWVQIVQTDGTTSYLQPPTSKEPLKNGEGFIVATETNGPYGVNLMLPVVLSALWLDGPSTYSTKEAIPAAVRAKIKNPIPYYLWLVFGGLYAPPVLTGGQAAIAPISYCLHPTPYSSNQPAPILINTILTMVWSQVVNNLPTASHEEEDISPDSKMLNIMGSYGTLSLTTDFNFEGDMDQGKNCFLDDNGVHCLPYVSVMSTMDSLKKINKIRIQIYNAAL